GLARERYYDLASLRQRRHHGGTICGAQGNQMSKLSYWAAVTLALEPQGSKLRTALRRSAFPFGQPPPMFTRNNEARAVMSQPVQNSPPQPSTAPPAPPPRPSDSIKKNG